MQIQLTLQDTHGLCAGQPETVRHLFQTCARVNEAWEWLVNIIGHILPPGTVDEEVFLNLQYPALSNSQEDSLIWLLGTYYQYVVEEIIPNDRILKVDELRSLLKYRLVAYRMRRLRPLLISGL